MAASRTLRQKLGLKEGMKTYFVLAPDSFAVQIGGIPEQEKGPAPVTLDYIQLFCRKYEDLEAHFEPCKALLAPDGMFWICWIKASSERITDFNGTDLRRYVLARGLVDIKVCAIDAHWSASKFVYRKQDRGLLRD